MQHAVYFYVKRKPLVFLLKNVHVCFYSLGSRQSFLTRNEWHTQATTKTEKKMKQASGASSLNFGLGYIYILIHYDLRMQAAMALASLLCFVLFDSLRPINNLSVEQAQVFLG